MSKFLAVFAVMAGNLTAEEEVSAENTDGVKGVVSQNSQAFADDLDRRSGSFVVL